MQAQNIVKIGSQTYIGFSAISLGYVAALSLISPQATMNLVATTLPNTDAVSSIRGIYGGVGTVITAQLLYQLFTEYRRALILLTFFWGAYALSRLITIFVEGPLGTFGNQWIVVEACLCVVGLVFVVLTNKCGKS